MQYNLAQQQIQTVRIDSDYEFIRSWQDQLDVRLPEVIFTNQDNLCYGYEIKST